MDKDEMIKALKEGKKVTHRYFLSGEWMKMDNGQIVFEDGVRCSVVEFFEWRRDPGWSFGYEVVNN